MLKRFTKSQQILHFFGISLILVFLSSCGVKKHLDPGQTLLKKNVIEFDSEKKIKDERGLKYDLYTIYKQVPNKKEFRLFRARLWFHYQAERRAKKTNKESKFRNWIQRVVAEKPAIYDESLSESTAKTMQYFMQNKGYYDAEVTFKPIHGKKTSKVVYTVKPKELYTIDSFRFESADPNIQRILEDISDKSHLKKGRAVSESTFSKEKNRIVKTLKDLGYAYFTENYIDPVGYTDTSKHTVDVVYKVLPLKGGAPHKVYTIGAVNITPAYQPSIAATLRDTIIDSIQFSINPEKPFIKPKVILESIHFRPDQIYKKSDFDRTQSHLSNLDLYKFLSVKPENEESDGEENKINYDIKLTPKKKQIIGWDVELNNANYSGIGTVSAFNLVGGGLSANYKNRNLNRSAISLALEGSLNTEIDFNNGFSFFTFDSQVGGELYFPKFFGLTGFWKGLRTFGLVSDQFYEDLRAKAKTRISGNYQYFLTVTFYDYHSFSLTRGYDVQLSPTNRVQINTSGINMLLPRFQPRFDTILMENPFLQRSFDKQLFTGLLFRDVYFTHTGKANKFGQSWYFGARFELSGAEVLLSNMLYNSIFNKDVRFKVGALDFEHYTSLELEARRYRKFSDQYTLAYKLKAGVALPFGKYTQEVPYIKQFPAGGPYGIRAWSLRELGPGGFFDPDNTDNVFFQAANFNLEFGIEYRFDLIGPFESAVFIDGGNIWSLDPNDERGESAQFSRDFYEQIALGTGFGIRIDIKYAVLRFDLGIKMRQPYIDPNSPNQSHWLFSEWKDFNNDLYAINFAIGYPF